MDILCWWGAKQAEWNRFKSGQSNIKRCNHKLHYKSFFVSLCTTLPCSFSDHRVYIYKRWIPIKKRKEITSPPYPPFFWTPFSQLYVIGEVFFIKKKEKIIILPFHTFRCFLLRPFHLLSLRRILFVSIPIERKKKGGTAGRDKLCEVNWSRSWSIYLILFDNSSVISEANAKRLLKKHAILFFFLLFVCLFTVIPSSNVFARRQLCSESFCLFLRHAEDVCGTPFYYSSF